MNPVLKNDMAGKASSEGAMSFSSNRMKAVILAAGEGTRLLPLTLQTPKCMIEIGGRPIIERILESLPEEIDEVIIVVNHLKEKIKDHLGNNFQSRGVKYAEQREKKGTFGALLSAQDLFQPGERFLVLNGDDLNDKEELGKFLKQDRTFGVQKMIMPNYYGLNIVDGNLDGFRPQTDEEKGEGTLIATGVYTLDTDIFSHPGVGVFGGEYGLPQTILAQKDKHPIKVIEITRWIPVNSFVDIERANKYLS